MTQAQPGRPPGRTRGLQPRFNSLIRSLGFAWIGVVMFVFDRPGPGVLAVQIICYAVAAAGLAGWVALEVRRAAVSCRTRWLPIALAVVATASGFGSGTGSGAVFLVIFAGVSALVAGADLSLGPALAVTGAGMLATEIAAIVYGGITTTDIGLPLAIASCVIIGRNRAAYRIQAEQAAALLAQREQLTAADRRAGLLDERARIAREIHDVLAHSLGALSIQIQAARSVLTDRGDIEQASDLLAAAQRMASEGLTDTRRAVQALRADTLPLDQELARAADSYAQRFGVTAGLTTSGQVRTAPPEATVALLRVAQEALVNAAKHAPGHRVTLGLDYRQTGIVLTVRNDLRQPGGAGAEPGIPGAGTHAGAPAGVQTADAGYGLTGMRERLRLLRGTLEAGCQDGQWVVTAFLPLPAPEASP